jgi:hypothetical protein
MRVNITETTEALEWGDLLLEVETFPAGLDTAPLLLGLPGDGCPCPHWGYVLRGSLVVRYDDGHDGRGDEGGHCERGRARGRPVGLRIDRRFRGPDESGNGGYSCGLVAGRIDGPAEVTLRSRPPLDRDLDVTTDGTDLQVLAGTELVATARPVDSVDVEPPDPPTWEEAVAASARSELLTVPLEKHAYPECFVCGAGRGERDGLRIFPGRVEGRPELMAASWIPDASLGAEVDDVFVWSALDCPSGFAWVHLGVLMILGRMAGEIYDRPAVGERCVVLGFPVERDGRKLHAGSALYGEDGRLLGKSRATWIDLGEWSA